MKKIKYKINNIDKTKNYASILNIKTIFSTCVQLEQVQFWRCIKSIFQNTGVLFFLHFAQCARDFIIIILSATISPHWK